ncbi:unnamed protein product [Angiostrongylus costaricensis]|uniref:6-pyruvoyl tetrahydrobiopterin synthase n=1 Tax=Angiostrongylus costaricensis TaxID=334426 RepID=A0A0R3PLT8_ANGCS|nr:unnamed protein product [Angiostrongylus costaricensis]
MVRGVVTMERIETFSAAHRLHSSQLSVEENQNIYGKCNNPNGHGHNYVWRVKLRGIPDPVTGMVYDLSELKKSMKAVLDTVDHKNLDKDVEWFQHNVSTTENVAIYLWEKLRVQMKTPKVLYKVTVEETPKNIFSYKGEI